MGSRWPNSKLKQVPTDRLVEEVKAHGAHTVAIKYGVGKGAIRNRIKRDLNINLAELRPEPAASRMARRGRVTKVTMKRTAPQTNGNGTGSYEADRGELIQAMARVNGVVEKIGRDRAKLFVTEKGELGAKVNWAETL